MQVSPATDFSAIHIIKMILQEAIQRNASDIHFEPCSSYFRIRIRIDGLLTEIHRLHSDQQNPMLSRLKIMAELDITERRLPQDGRFTFSENNTSRDCRISSCPTQFGEKIVIRLLDVKKNLLQPNELGMNAQQLELFQQALHQPQGLILVTGPTGSGKTITLYSALNQLNQITHNISTIEDPIEIQLPGINQTQTKTKIGLTFAKILRTLLRQDPDIILIGEIRDEETAEMAVRAAQTGHLVLASLHANNATETINRLTNLKIASINLANSLNMILAQRLVRKLCENCKTKKVASEQDTASFYQSNQCKLCVSGYLGRTAVFEVLPISSKLSELIAKGCHPHQLYQQATQEGMIRLWDAAMTKVQQGLTTVNEISRVINPGKS